MSDETKQTTIAEGTEFEGSIRSEAHINLSGVLKGRLDAPTLTVTSTGRLDGTVKVEELRSHGEISGEIEAETAELAGKVSDNTVIRAKKLDVKLSKDNGGIQVSFGNCDLEVGSRQERDSYQHRGNRAEDEDDSHIPGEADLIDAAQETMI